MGISILQLFAPTSIHARPPCARVRQIQKWTLGPALLLFEIIILS